MSLKEQVDQIEQEATSALRAAKTEAGLFPVNSLPDRRRAALRRGLDG